MSEPPGATSVATRSLDVGTGPGPARHADLFFAALAARDERDALAAALGAIEAGVDTESVLLDVVAAAQRRVGTEWAANRFSVAQEHAATAISERVIAAVMTRPDLRAGLGAQLGRITVACADGEWHGLPARLLAEVLTLRGWQIDYLGAHVPGPHLIAHLHETGPDAVALSSSLSTRLPKAHAMITACQAAAVPVIVGGAAFGPDGRYARLLGADAWAADARSAADRLAAPLARPRPPHQAVEDLPHLLDQEYTMISRSRAAIVSDVLDELPRRFPAMRAYTDQQMQYTAEDIAHIVDHLASALYVDDRDLFAGFIGWTASILQARHVPLNSLDAGLAILEDRLRDFPRALRFLAAGRVAATREER